MTERTDDDEYNDHRESKPSHRRIEVPKLSLSLGLDASGNFVEVINRTRSNLKLESARQEDSIMDQRKKMSYVEVTSAEKRDVYKLDVVKRSMRRLPHAALLMARENLEVSTKYMEIGPNRASLMQIGYDSINNRTANSRLEKTGREVTAYISTFYRWLSNVQGNHWFWWPIQAAAFLGEITFWIRDISQNGATMINASALFAALFRAPLNLWSTWTDAYGNFPLATDLAIEDGSLTHYIYLSLKGVDILSAAQERMAQENRSEVQASASMKEWKRSVLRSCMIEAIVVHFMIGFAPAAFFTLRTFYRRWEEDTLTLVLTGLLFWAWTLSLLTNCGIAYCIRLIQKLQDLEIRRAQCDIRTCPASLIHRITPRFKALLHEAHMVGNRCHVFYFFVIPVLLTYIFQMVGGVFITAFGQQAEDGYEEDEGSADCVAAWVFFFMIQPLISLLVWTHGFATLNLAIERDVDQDIMEMNIRLTFSDSHVPNWLLQQMICLERLDGRAYGLPFDFIPSVESTRKMASSLITAAMFIGPYLLSISDKLSSEITCPRYYE